MLHAVWSVYEAARDAEGSGPGPASKEVVDELVDTVRRLLRDDRKLLLARPQQSVEEEGCKCCECGSCSIGCHR